MALYLIETDGPVPTSAVRVDVCNEDGTVHDSRFMCPTCSLRPDGRWSD